MVFEIPFQNHYHYVMLDEQMRLYFNVQITCISFTRIGIPTNDLLYSLITNY